MALKPVHADRKGESSHARPLVNLMVSEEERAELSAYANEIPSLQLSARSLCDLELLAVGALSPLDRFMGEADYVSVLEHMRLADSTLFPMPLTLPVAKTGDLAIGKCVALRNQRNELIAEMTIEELFDWDLERESMAVLGTTDARHPMKAEMAGWDRSCIAGPIKVSNLPAHYDFIELRKTPGDVRASLRTMTQKAIVAFLPHGHMHRSYEEFTKQVAVELRAALLIQPAVGVARYGDTDYYPVVRTTKVLVDKYYPRDCTVLTVLPLATRHVGPREALWYALIHRNYGATHVIVEPDHASPGKDSQGRPFYDSLEAQRLVAKYQDELGITMVPFQGVVYLPDEQRYEEKRRVRPGVQTAMITPAELSREYLNNGKALPAWFTRPEIAAILARMSPPTHEQGFCVWFTGLSGAGKSTIAEVLANFLMEHGRQVTLLDGDVVRTHLSKGLGFSKEDRDRNIRRIGFVAAEIVRHHGVVVCAAVSPYRTTRNQVRAIVGEDRFIEVFVDTPLEVCEQRDEKGMYAKARRGEIKGFTGVDDPYEAPVKPELRVTTTDTPREENARRIMDYLKARGLLLAASDERNYR